MKKKEKKVVKKRYFKLGKEADSFSDAKSGLMIRGKKEIVSLAATKLHGENRLVEEALTGGHIVEIYPGNLKSSDTITDLPLPETGTKFTSKKIEEAPLDDEEDMEEIDEDEDEAEEDKKTEEEEEDEDLKIKKPKKVKAKK